MKAIIHEALPHLTRVAYEMQPSLDNEHVDLAIFTDSTIPVAEFRLSLPEVRAIVSYFEATTQKINEKYYHELEIARAQGREREFLEKKVEKEQDFTQSHIEDFE